MKKLGLFVAALLAAQLSRSAPASAQLGVVYYCELDGRGYSTPGGSYAMCIDNCYAVDSQNQRVYGECWDTPPPEPPPPGNPAPQPPQPPATEQ